MVSGVTGEVVAMMVLWNKVSLIYPYLYDIRSGIGEGLVRVWSTLDLASGKGLSEFAVSCLLIFFRSWHLMCLSGKAIGWLLMQ